MFWSTTPGAFAVQNVRYEETETGEDKEIDEGVGGGKEQMSMCMYVG